MSTFREFITKCVRLAWIPALTFASSILVAEGVYRAAGIRVAATMEGFYEAFGQNGYKHRAYAASYMNWHSGPFHVYTDQWGMRTGAAMTEASGQSPQPDVLVIGDSQAFGQGLDFPETLIGQFAQRAGADGVTVLNAAIGGHMFKNQIELLRWLMTDRGLRPRCVLLCLTPRFLGNPEGYSDAFIYNGALFGAAPGRRELTKKWFSSHSAVYIAIRDAMQRSNAAPDAGNAALDLYRRGPRADEAMVSLRQRLTELQAIVDSKGTALVVCYAPLAVESRVGELGKSAGLSDIDQDLPESIAAQLAHAAGAPLVDLRPVLGEARAANEPITLDGDPHYGPAVSRRAGAALWAGVDWKALVGRGPRGY